MKRIRLTHELSRQIAASIHAGGYPHVAAEAFGVPKDVFDDWLKRGNRRNAREPYRSFAQEVRQAFATARLLAETAGYKKNPKLWLVNGPGRESEQNPGWSVSVKPMETTAAAERNVLCDPELMALLRTVLEVLAPFPEARTRLAEALTNLGVKTKPQQEERKHGETSTQRKAG